MTGFVYLRGFPLNIFWVNIKNEIFCHLSSSHTIPHSCLDVNIWMIMRKKCLIFLQHCYFISLIVILKNYYQYRLKVRQRTCLRGIRLDIHEPNKYICRNNKRAQTCEQKETNQSHNCNRQQLLFVSREATRNTRLHNAC